MQFELMIVHSFSFSMCPGWSSVLGILENEPKRRQLLESFHRKDKCNTFRVRIGKQQQTDASLPKDWSKAHHR